MDRASQAVPVNAAILGLVEVTGLEADRNGVPAGLMLLHLVSQPGRGVRQAGVGLARLRPGGRPGVRGSPRLRTRARLGLGEAGEAGEAGEG